MSLLIKHPYKILFVLATLVYIIGMASIPIMGIDSTQYASISMEMLFSGDYLHVKNHYADYLDKPPLLFWICTFFFKIFGVYDWVFRLPSFLSTILGVFSVYRFSILFYNKRVALNAALILYTCQAYFLINHDVRTDTLLANFVIFVCWQLAAFIKSGKFIYVIGAFTGIGLAMLEKGPIGFMVPVLALGTHLILTKDFKNIFRWQWLIGILITAVILLPMCIGLYQQFDLHPEKIVNGKTGVSGLRFFFWEQSFGRITGENVWKDDSTYFFFTHTFIWSFLPWSFLAIVAFFKRIISLKNKELNPEFYTIGGFTLAFVALSFSQYKLPHYIFVIFPLAAVFTSAWLDKVVFFQEKKIKNWLIFHIMLCALLLMVVVGINIWSFPFFNKPLIIILILFFLIPIASSFLLYRNQGDMRLLFMTGYTAIFINLLLNLNFYPCLLKYQSGTEAGIYLKDKKLKAENCYYYHNVSYGLDFYSKVIWNNPNGTPWEDILKKNKGDIWIFTNQIGINEISKSGFKIAEEKMFNDFNVTAITLPFLNPSTREQSLEKTYLIRLENIN